MPFIEMINRYTESYLNYLSLEYDLVLSRKQLYHRMLIMIRRMLILQQLGTDYTSLIDPLQCLSFENNARWPNHNP